MIYFKALILLLLYLISICFFQKKALTTENIWTCLCSSDHLTGAIGKNMEEGKKETIMRDFILSLTVLLGCSLIF